MVMDALIERMNDTIHELNEKARHSKNGKIAKSYLAEAASVTKMMKGILHNTAQMEARKSGSSYELSEIVHYIRENDLISDEKLQGKERKSVMRKIKKKSIGYMANIEGDIFRATIQNLIKQQKKP